MATNTASAAGTRVEEEPIGPNSADALREFASQAQSAGDVVQYRSPLQASVTSVDSVITAQKVVVERDEAKVLSKIRVMAAAAGDDWYYHFPVKKKGGGEDAIEGASVKCAQNVARIYGNCQVDTRLVDEDDHNWQFLSRFVDLETGFSITRPFQQRKGQTTMGRDAGRSLDIAFQIGASKATRNVICNAIETFTNYAFDEAKRSVIDKIGKDLPRYRDRIIDRLEKLGVPLARVEVQIGRTAPEWRAQEMAKIIAQLQAIADGMATIEDNWPGAGPPAPKREDFNGAPPKQTQTAEPTKPAATQQQQQQKQKQDAGPTAEDAGMWEQYDEHGVLAQEFGNARDWAIHFVKVWTPETSAKLFAANEHVFPILQEELGADPLWTDIQELKNRPAPAKTAAPDAPEQTGAPETAATVKDAPAAPKPALAPIGTAPDGSFLVSPYFERLYAEMKLAPTAEMVDAIMVREKPNFALLEKAKIGISGVKLRASKRKHELANAPYQGEGR